MGICPNCKQHPREILVEDITLNGGPQAKRRGLTFSCSSCHSILSVGFDSLTLQSDFLDDVREIVQSS
jgi:hypothetical protein